MRLTLFVPLPRPSSAPPFLIRRISTQLTVTDPLALYQNLVESNSLRVDELQFRAAVELQKLSRRLRDYTPPESFSKRIQELSTLLSEVDRRKMKLKLGTEGGYPLVLG